LKTIASAQADFRLNDRDGNGLEDYWRPDVAGLYALQAGGEAIKLIELSVATADDRPAVKMDASLVRSAKAGFWYRALRHENEVTRGPDRFAACGFPVSIADGRYGTYVISEENVVRKKMLGHARGLLTHPTRAQFKEEDWERLD
jgi:hypothetical protein